MIARRQWLSLVGACALAAPLRSLGQPPGQPARIGFLIPASTSSYASRVEALRATLTVIDSPYGRIGSVICWENYMPMLRMAMYAKNVALYCAPTADDRDTWLASMQHVALEGRCFVLSACQFLRKSAFPEGVRVSLGDSADAVLMRGGSAIISPLGKVLAGPHFEGETILVADLDLNEIGRGKFDFDVAGHYARPDVFQLSVNEQAAPAVVRNRGE